ncbi:MAG: ATP-binding protein [Acidimicrobiales bacterium]|nr:ATP-binding protein [Acidimicrobiales bacterium]
MPASTDHLRLVRLMVAALANEHGADLDDLDDLRLAVGELCAHAIADAGDDDRLAVRALVDDGRVRIEVATHDGTATTGDENPFPGVAVPTGVAPIGLDELVGALLTTVTDAFGVATDGPPRGWFERRLRGVADPR